jgi:hypothetical protein
VEELIFGSESPEDVLKAILDQAKSARIESSEPAPSTATSSPLRSPISGAEIKEVLEVAILVFKSGAAAGMFLIVVHQLNSRIVRSLSSVMYCMEVKSLWQNWPRGSVREWRVCWSEVIPLPASLPWQNC